MTMIFFESQHGPIWINVDHISAVFETFSGGIDIQVGDRTYCDIQPADDIDGSGLDFIAQLIEDAQRAVS